MSTAATSVGSGTRPREVDVERDPERPLAHPARVDPQLMIDTWAIVNAIVAPNANRPPSRVDVGRHDQPDRDHRRDTIATCGVGSAG